MYDAWPSQNAGTAASLHCDVVEIVCDKLTACARVTVCAVGRTMFSLTEYMAQRVDSPFNIVIPTNKGRKRSFSKFPSKIRAGKSNIACSRIIELFPIFFFYETMCVSRIFTWLHLRKKYLQSKTFYISSKKLIYILYILFHIYYIFDIIYCIHVLI